MMPRTKQLTASDAKYKAIFESTGTATLIVDEYTAKESFQGMLENPDLAIKSSGDTPYFSDSRLICPIFSCLFPLRISLITVREEDLL